MGALNLMMNEALDAIDELGKKSDFENDGYHFKYDPNTRGIDDVTIRAGNNEFVLAIVWKNLPGYKPSLPNLRHAFDNCGWVVRDKEYLEKLEKRVKELEIEVDSNCGQCYKESDEKLKQAVQMIGELCQNIKVLNNPNVELTDVNEFLKKYEQFVKENE